VANSAECTACLDCMEACPEGAITFSAQPGIDAYKRYDPSRRQFLGTLGLAAAGAVLLRFIPLLGRKEAALIRPPGSSEALLQSKCIRCGLCVRVCPTGVIQPSPNPRNGQSLWTPMLATRLGYCDYSCNACGQVCPTGAIEELPLEERRNRVIGIARIDQRRCIPWSEGRECIVCEEMCPVPQKAIHLNGAGMGNRGGRAGGVALPRVREELCIGCGICEHQCPVAGEAAIRVFPVDSGGD
jgi:MauM/NapG family ferredoxin protein